MVFVGKAHGMFRLPFESLLDFYWLLDVVLVRPALPFDQVLESLSAPWCLRVQNAFYLIYV